MKAGWEVRPLGEVLERTETVDPTRAPHSKFLYVDVSSVSNENFEITGATEMLGADAPSRARRRIAEGDVIFATIRPTLQRIAQVPRDLHGEVCSTGFIVLRATPRLEPRYLYYFLFSDAFTRAMETLQTGASYPAVTDGQVRQQPIPLPPLDEQKRIVAVLDEAFEGLSRARANAEANLADARELFARHAASLFDHAAAEARSTRTVAEIASPEKGSIRTGPFGSQLLHSEFVESGVAVLGIDNAVKNEFQWAKRRFITEEKYKELSRYTVRPGDVIITIMGTCGRCAVVPDDIPRAINTKHLCCITLDQQLCSPDFLHAYFLYSPVARDYLDAQVLGSIMDGLNMGIIKEMPVSLPALDVQKDVVSAISEMRGSSLALAASYSDDIAELHTLRQSLLQKAFSGELTR